MIKQEIKALWVGIFAALCYLSVSSPDGGSTPPPPPPPPPSSGWIPKWPIWSLLRSRSLTNMTWTVYAISIPPSGLPGQYLVDFQIGVQSPTRQWVDAVNLETDDIYLSGSV